VMTEIALLTLTEADTDRLEWICLAAGDWCMQPRFLDKATLIEVLRSGDREGTERGGGGQSQDLGILQFQTECSWPIRAGLITPLPVILPACKGVQSLRVTVSPSVIVPGFVTVA
jgi:hypothetical protein